MRKIISACLLLTAALTATGASAQPLPIYPEPPEPQNSPSYAYYVEPDNPVAPGSDSAAGAIPRLSFAGCDARAWGFQRTPDNPTVGTKRQVDWGGMASCVGTDHVITSVTFKLYLYTASTRTWTLKQNCPVAFQNGNLVLSQTPCSLVPAPVGIYSATVTIYWKFRGITVKPTSDSHIFQVA